ncbi:MAG: AsmA-like C-terminal region-containing protein [Bacteroidota bacterium]
MKRFKKILKIFFITLFSVIALTIAACFVLVYFYEDKIKDYAKAELNKQLNSEVEVKDIELTIFSTFPYASIKFSGVIAKDATTAKNKGELLKAENVYLLFNVWNLFDETVSIKKIIVEDGSANIVVFRDGTDNYHFWKECTDTASSESSMEFDLQKVVLNNMNIHYRNRPEEQNFSVLAKYILFKGNFRDSFYKLKVDGETHVNYLKFGKVNFINQQDVDVFLQMDVTNAEQYNIEKGTLTYAGQDFVIKGNVFYGDAEQKVDLSIGGSSMRVEDVIDDLPKNYRSYFDKYDSKGDLKFDAQIKGSFKGNDYHAINITFKITNAELVEKENNIALKNLNFNGRFSNGNIHTIYSSFIDISDLSADFNGKRITAEMKIVNLARPDIRIKSAGSLNLKDLSRFIETEEIKEMEGDIAYTINFQCQPDNLENFTAADFIKSKTTGELTLTNGKFSLTNEPYSFNNISTLCKFSNNDLIVDKMTGNYSKTDFQLNGTFINALAFFFLDNEKLMIDAKLSSSNVSLDELLKDGESSAKSGDYNFEISPMLDFNIDLSVTNVYFRKFHATGVQGNIRLKDQKGYTNNLTLRVMDGSASIEGYVDGSRKNEILISCDAHIEKMDIKKLFYQFENFGQSSMKDENLKGKVTSDIQLASVWSPSLEVDMKKLYAKADISIENGELQNYEPLKGLSRFMKLKDVERVTFSTLKNQIEIKNETIFIPAMEIKSSELNLTVSGQHKFNNEIQYNVRLLLSEILANKAKKAKKENEDFGVVEEDGLGKTSIYVKITGTVDDPKYAYDSKGWKAKIIVGVMKEKQNLKTILNEEFNWFKKDSAVIKNKEKDKQKDIDKKKDKGKNKDPEDKFKVEFD